MIVRIRDLLAAVRRQREGATAVEYSVMVALIAAVIITTVLVVGESSEDNFDCVSSQISTSGSGNC